MQLTIKVKYSVIIEKILELPNLELFGINLLLVFRQYLNYLTKIEEVLVAQELSDNYTQ